MQQRLGVFDIELIALKANCVELLIKANPLREMQRGFRQHFRRHVASCRKCCIIVGIKMASCKTTQLSGLNRTIANCRYAWTVHKWRKAETLGRRHSLALDRDVKDTRKVVQCELHNLPFKRCISQQLCKRNKIHHVLFCKRFFDWVTDNRKCRWVKPNGRVVKYKWEEVKCW